MEDSLAGRGGYTSKTMAMTVRARVRNGRLVVDEPTDLADGTELDLVAVDADDEEWNLAEAQITELEESMAQADRGEVVPGEEVLRDLRSGR